jgi:hypothetical protein
MTYLGIFGGYELYIYYLMLVFGLPFAGIVLLAILYIQSNVASWKDRS